MVRLVQGVGINDGKYPTRVNGSIKKEYRLWTNMLGRCYNEETKKKYPTYIGCSVSDNFKSYSYFYEWCQSQIGFNQNDYHLDKDLITKGNKIYSEDTCVFIPPHINNLLIKSNSARGILPIGVTKNKEGFQAQCSVYSVSKKLGTYSTTELAFNAYKVFKEEHIKELTEKYKDTIDPRAYKALLNYEVHIDD